MNVSFPNFYYRQVLPRGRIVTNTVTYLHLLRLPFRAVSYLSVVNQWL